VLRFWNSEIFKNREEGLARIANASWRAGPPSRQSRTTFATGDLPSRGEVKLLALKGDIFNDRADRRHCGAAAPLLPGSVGDQPRPRTHPLVSGDVLFAAAADRQGTGPFL